MTAPSTAPGMAHQARGLTLRRPGHALYLGIAVAALATVFVGFAPSFYLRPATLPRLAPIVMAHGIIFSSWVVLFVAQATLVATGHTALHRRLGLAGVVLAVLIVVLGPLIAFPAAARPGGLPGDPIAFLFVILVDVLLFAIFVAAAIFNWNRSETHKRLMLLAMVSLLPPAISRWPIAVGRPAVIAGVLFAFVAAAPIYDLATRRRPSRISLWGGLAILASVPVRLAISQTEGWHRLARWLIG